MSRFTDLFQESVPEPAVEPAPTVKQETAVEPEPAVKETKTPLPKKKFTMD
jgi:hypothetical protein